MSNQGEGSFLFAKSAPADGINSVDIQTVHEEPRFGLTRAAVGPEHHVVVHGVQKRLLEIVGINQEDGTPRFDATYGFGSISPIIYRSPQEAASQSGFTFENIGQDLHNDENHEAVAWRLPGLILATPNKQTISLALAGAMRSRKMMESSLGEFVRKTLSSNVLATDEAFQDPNESEAPTIEFIPLDESPTEVNILINSEGKTLLRNPKAIQPNDSLLVGRLSVGPLHQTEDGPNYAALEWSVTGPSADTVQAAGIVVQASGSVDRAVALRRAREQEVINRFADVVNLRRNG